MTSTYRLLATLKEQLDLSVPQFLHLSSEEKDRANLCVGVCNIGVNVCVCVCKCVCDFKRDSNGYNMCVYE